MGGTNLEVSAKKAVFLVSPDKTQISQLLAPLPKKHFWKNPLVPPLEKILPTPMHTSM